MHIRIFESAFILYLSIFQIGCDLPKGSSIEKAFEPPKIFNETGDLNKLISLPAKPISLRWQEPDPASKESAELIAFMTFSDDDYPKIIDESPSFDLVQDEKLPKEMFDFWIPSGVAAKLDTEVVNNYVYLKGIHPLQPTLFTKTKMSPFVNGSITPLGDGHILLYLYTM